MESDDDFQGRAVLAIAAAGRHSADGQFVSQQTERFIGTGSRTGRRLGRQSRRHRAISGVNVLDTGRIVVGRQVTAVILAAAAADFLAGDGARPALADAAATAAGAAVDVGVGQPRVHVVPRTARIGVAGRQQTTFHRPRHAAGGRPRRVRRIGRRRRFGGR